MQFETTRSEIGELLYNFKYGSDLAAAKEISSAAEAFMKQWNPPVDVIVPVPPSTNRATQPVLMLAQAVSDRLKIPLVDCVVRTREIPQLKNIYDLDARLELLQGLHEVDKSVTRGKSILLFDDLYRSGATMNVITTELYQKGEAKDVFALTISRTRSNQ